MSFQPALPPWLIKAVEEAGEATVILKPGDRPFVIKSKAPYHLGTQPMTNLTMEGLAQQILSEDAQETLSRGENVEEILEGSDQRQRGAPGPRHRHQARATPLSRSRKSTRSRDKLEEEARIIKAASAQALRDAAATGTSSIIVVEGRGVLRCTARRHSSSRMLPARPLPTLNSTA